MTLRGQIERALSTSTAIVLPGVYDALSARLAEQIGFEALYVTGAGLANSRLGVPDLGFVGLSQLCEHVACIAEVVDSPLLVDADTGYGNAAMLTRTVRQLERAGAAGIQIEDQLFPKRCGHFTGISVIPAGEMASKVRAAVESRRGDDLVIVARTDARAAEGLDAAIERACMYRDAGADVIFVEALRDAEELRRVGQDVPGPLMANMVEGGVTPLLSRAELGSLGFTITLYANVALRAAQAGVTRALETLRREGSTNSILDEIASWEERQAAVGKPYYDELERRYGEYEAAR